MAHLTQCDVVLTTYQTVLAEYTANNKAGGSSKSGKRPAKTKEKEEEDEEEEEEEEKAGSSSGSEEVSDSDEERVEGKAKVRNVSFCSRSR